MKLCDLVDIVENNEVCVILKIKEDKKMELITLGCFNLDYNLIRLTKGDNHTITIFKTDNSSYSYEFGRSGYTLISEDKQKEKELILECIEKDFDIYIGEDINKIRASLFIKNINDKKNRLHIITSMYRGSQDNKCVHKDNEYYRWFKSEKELFDYYKEINGDLQFIGQEISKQTGCIIDRYLLTFN